MWKRNPLKSDEGGQALAANRLIGSWEFCGGQSANLSVGHFQLAGWSSSKWWTLHFTKSPTFPEGYLSFNWQTALSVVIPQIGQKCISWRWNIYPGRGFTLLGAFGTKESINIKVSSKNVTIAVHCFSLYYESKHIYYIFFGFQQLTNNDCSAIRQQRNSEWLNIILAFGSALNAPIYDSEWTLLFQFKPIRRIIQTLCQP